MLPARGMPLAPLYMRPDGISELGHGGLPTALPIPALDNQRSQTYPEVFFIS